MGVWSELGISLNRLRGELTVGDDVRVDVVVSQLVNLEIRLAMFVGSLNIPLKVALSLRVFMPEFIFSNTKSRWSIRNCFGTGKS